MNPFGVSGSVFSTTANQSANSFSNPTSPSHMTGGWGVDPSQMTPSYDAPYRPRFSGPSPYSAYQKPSWAGGIGNLINPFAASPYWGNPIDHAQDSIDSVSQKPFDAAARIGQRFVAPAVAYGLAQKIMVGSYFQGPNSLWNGGGGWAAGVGRSFGGGLARGLGMGGAAGALGTVGAIGGAIALPMIVGHAVTTAVDHAIFQPYARTREIMNDLRTNFSGVTFSDAQGSPSTGRGLGRREAAGLASQIDSMGIRDTTWSATQMGSIANMSARSGLLDGSNSKQLVGQIKSISEQIKMIVSISKDPSVQGAIEELAKLRMGGASISGGINSAAGSAYSMIGMHASQAGMSVQRMMSEAMQGQYMFGMNGMTPYLGQLAYGNARAGFGAARRNGVISDAQMARMGGEEGATQSVLAGNIASIQTPYNRMLQANKFLFGSSNGGSAVANIAQFGNNAARDPLGTMGKMMLNQGAMDSADSQNPMHAEQQGIALLRAKGVAPGLGGKYRPEQLAMAWAEMGMTQDQIVAMAQTLSSQSNSGVMTQKYAASQAQTIEQLHQVMEQYNLSTSAMGVTQNRASRAYKGAKAAIAESIGHPIAEYAGYTGDVLESSWRDFWYGKTIGDKNAAGKYGDVQGALAKITGQEGSAIDQFALLGEAAKFRAYRAAHPEESISESLRKLGSEGGYENLMKSVDGMSAVDAFEKIKKMTNQGLTTGYMKAGLMARKGMTMDQLTQKAGGKLQGVTLKANDETMSEDGFAALFSRYDTQAKADAGTSAYGDSQVDWSGMSIASGALDKGANHLSKVAEHLESVTKKLDDVMGGKAPGPEDQKEWANWGKLFRGDWNQKQVGK